MFTKAIVLALLSLTTCRAQSGGHGHEHDHTSGASYTSFFLSGHGGLGGSSGGGLGGGLGGGSEGHHVVHAAPIAASHGHHQEHYIDYQAHPKYEFKYGIADGHTHDHHSQHEVRDGDVVHGEYSLHEPDGTIRIVKYTADKKNGFNAQVIRQGHAVHPETSHKGHFVHYGGGHGHGGN